MFWKSPEVTFPRISQILESRKDIVKLLQREFGDEVPDSILIVTGPRATQAFADVYGSLIKEEWSSNLTIRVLKDPPSVSGVSDLENWILKEMVPPPSLIIYVGSQTVADSTKALVSRLRNRFLDRNIIFGGLITGLSGDGVFSSTASLRDLEGIPVSTTAVAPNFIVGHTLTLLREPYDMKSSCIGDILSKIPSLWDYNYSCSVLNKYHDNFSANLAKAAYESLLQAEVKDRHFLHTQEAIETLFRAVQLCGLSMQLTGSSETCSGSEHVGEKWLQEYIIRLNHKLHDRLDTPKHGAALMPMVITTLYMQGQGEKAEKVKEIGRKLGLPCTAQELGLNGTIIQMCLALGFGYRCPRYVAYLLGEAPFPNAKDVKNERATVLEQVEFKVLLDAIRQCMVDSEVSKKEDFGELDAARFGAMRDIAHTAVSRLERDVKEKVDIGAAQKVRAAVEEVILKDYR
jgi:glycerol dehydrogenase-like iron-containing ADH family enzyme